MHKEISEQKTKSNLGSKLLLPGLILASLLMFGVLLWQDWGSKPVEDLPPFYWLVYALFLGILVAVFLVGRSRMRSMRAAIILSAIFIVHGTVFTLLPLISEWNGTRIMTFALGIWFLLYSAILIVSLKRSPKSKAH